MLGLVSFQPILHTSPAANKKRCHITLLVGKKLYHIMDGIIETSRLARKAYEYSDYIVVITVVH